MGKEQKKQESWQLIEAVLNFLAQNGVDARLMKLYEGGKQSVGIILPGLDPKELKPERSWDGRDGVGE